MMALLTFFGLSFSALLPLINPLGDALVFLGLIGPAPPAVYRRLAKRVAINTSVFLILIESAGAAIIKFFGISLPVMQVSGGLVLAAMGWRLLSQDEPTPAVETAASPATAVRSRRRGCSGTAGSRRRSTARPTGRWSPRAAATGASRRRRRTGAGRSSSSRTARTRS